MIARARVTAVALLASLATLPAAATTTQSPLQDAFFAYGDSGDGWTGGDGTYSVPLPDGRTAWLFSDTFLGTVNEDGSRPAGTPLVHNSIVIEDNGSFSTRVGGDEFEPRSLVETPDGWSWYWLGDGTVAGDELLVFLFHFVPVPGPLLFQQTGVALARFSLPEVELVSVERLPHAFVPGSSGGPVSYGSAILEAGDRVYVYGVEDLRLDKFLFLARTSRDLRAPWEYWTGSGWSPVPAFATRLLGGVANELSVTPWGDGYLLVAQDHAIGRDILAYDAPEPWGPFTGRRVLFSTPETDAGLVTYNAKAHPGRAPDGALLVTYNVNSWTFSDLFEDVDNYRPRFIDVTP